MEGKGACNSSSGLLDTSKHHNSSGQTFAAFLSALKRILQRVGRSGLFLINYHCLLVSRRAILSLGHCSGQSFLASMDIDMESPLFLSVMAFLGFHVEDFFIGWPAEAWKWISADCLTQIIVGSCPANHQLSRGAVAIFDTLAPSACSLSFVHSSPP